MANEEVDKIIEDNKEAVVEMIEFWIWIRGLNKAIKWIALIGFPFAAAIWSLVKWLQKHSSH